MGNGADVAKRTLSAPRCAQLLLGPTLPGPVDYSADYHEDSIDQHQNEEHQRPRASRKRVTTAQGAPYGKPCCNKQNAEPHHPEEATLP